MLLFLSPCTHLHMRYTQPVAKLLKKNEICKKKAKYSLKNLDFNLKRIFGFKLVICYWLLENEV